MDYHQPQFVNAYILQQTIDSQVIDCIQTAINLNET